MKHPKITVLYGGSSNERAVSLRSGKHVAEQLERAGYTVHLVDTAEPDFILADVCGNGEVVISMLHGGEGEDGTMQHALEELQVSYFGSSAVVSELVFNKVACKAHMNKAGILTPKGDVVDQKGYETSPFRHAPHVLKPIEGGSTIDTIIVHDHNKLPVDQATYDMLFARYGEMLLEELIVGQEITVAVLGDKALPVILIMPPEGEDFNYENKYNGRSKEIAAPATIEPQLQQQAQRLAEQVHHITGCRHLSRTDIIITNDEKLYVLETNTIPGMTEQSLVPKAAAAAGMSMSELAEQFVSMAVAA